LSQDRWAEPQDGWRPLHLAVFDAVSASLDELTELLKEQTGAYEALIDRETGCFRFSFPDGTTGGGSPPAILQSYEDGPKEMAPELEAELLSNTEGFVRIGEEEAAQKNKRWQLIYRATGLVWRQYMVRAFCRAVEAREAIPYARVQSLTAPFEPLPSDVWPALNVLDWQIGTAVDDAGTFYWSIHVAPHSVSSAYASSQPKKRPGPGSPVQFLEDAQIIESVLADPGYSPTAFLEPLILKHAKGLKSEDDVRRTVDRVRRKLRRGRKK
jgi:hypothetical protein